MAALILCAFLLWLSKTGANGWIAEGYLSEGFLVGASNSYTVGILIRESLKLLCL